MKNWGFILAMAACARVSGVLLPPTVAAARARDARGLEEALASRSAVDSGDEFGYSALDWACALNWPQGVHMLLADKADPNRATSQGESPLALAAQSGCLDCVRALIDAGAAMNHANARPADAGNGGFTPLHEAVTEGHMAIAAALLRAGANVDARDIQGRTPLALAAHRPSVAVLVKLLLDRGADPRAKDHSGRTPLHEAAGSSAVAVACLLLRAGADPSARDVHGKTASDLAGNALISGVLSSKRLRSRCSDIILSRIRSSHLEMLR